MSDLVEAVRRRLQDVLDPCSVAAGDPSSILDLGLIDRIVVSDGHLDVFLCLTSPTCPMLEHFAKESRRVLADLPEVVTVALHGDNGMNWSPDRMSASARHRRRSHLAALERRGARGATA